MAGFGASAPKPAIFEGKFHQILIAKPRTLCYNTCMRGPTAALFCPLGPERMDKLGKTV
jgi:hypothetical protein